MEILPVNGEEGNVRPDSVRYASVGWDKLTLTTGAGDIYEVPLMSHAAVDAGGYAPGSFGLSLHERDAATRDELLIVKPTPALTGKAYVHFIGTRWSCSAAEAIAFCNLETRLLNNIGAHHVSSCEQSIWWQDEPNFWHYLLVNNRGAYTFQAPGPLTLQENAVIPLKIPDDAPIRCACDYIQRDTTNGRAAFP